MARDYFWFKNLHFRRLWAISISIFSRSRSFILTPTPFLSTLTSFTGTGTFRPSPSLPNPEPTLNPIFIISLRPLFSGSASVKLDFISFYFHKIPFIFSNWILKSYLVANASSLASIICSAIRFRLFSRCCSLCSASFCLYFDFYKFMKFTLHLIFSSFMSCWAFLPCINPGRLSSRLLRKASDM